MNALPDHTLLQMVQGQQQAAFEILYARYNGVLRRHLQQINHDDAAAEDLLQEVFLRVWTKAEQWSGQGTCRAWLFRIATNLAINRLRKLRRHPEQPLQIEGCADNADDEDWHVPGWMVDKTTYLPEQAYEITEGHMLMQTIIDTLPEKKREVVRLMYEWELEPQDVADVLNIPAGTVRSRLHYARKQLTPLWKNLTKEWED